jgi:hypothetical protein
MWWTQFAVHTACVDMNLGVGCGVRGSQNPQLVDNARSAQLVHKSQPGYISTVLAPGRDYPSPLSPPAASSPPPAKSAHPPPASPPLSSSSEQRAARGGWGCMVYGIGCPPARGAQEAAHRPPPTVLELRAPPPAHAPWYDGPCCLPAPPPPPAPGLARDRRAPCAGVWCVVYAT